MVIKNHFQRYISVHKDKLTESYPPGSVYNAPLTEGDYKRFGWMAEDWEVFSVPVDTDDFVRCVMSIYWDGDAPGFAGLACSTFEALEGGSIPLVNRNGQWDTAEAIIENFESPIGWYRIESCGYVPPLGWWLNFWRRLGAPDPPDPWGSRFDQLFVAVNGELKIRIQAKDTDFPAPIYVP